MKYSNPITPEQMQKHIMHFTKTCPLKSGEKVEFVVIGVDENLYKVVLNGTKFGTIRETSYQIEPTKTGNQNEHR